MVGVEIEEVVAVAAEIAAWWLGVVM